MKPLGVGAQIGVEQGLLMPRLALDLLGLFEQVDEHRDLGAKNDGIDRFEHIIDRTHRISAEEMLGLLVDRRQEDDGNALGLLAAANDLGGFVTVHAWHVDVEQDDRELTLQEVAERLLARSRKHDFAEILEHRGDGEQIALVIVDQKHARAYLIGGRSHLRFRARGHGNISHGAVHLYSAASSGIGIAAPAAASRLRATQTRRSASRSSMSTGFAM